MQISGQIRDKVFGPVNRAPSTVLAMTEPLLNLTIVFESDDQDDWIVATTPKSLVCIVKGRPARRRERT